ncbi:MAG: M23 family metallopeptidase, partial [Clostridia bacterium]|nr:M23 family metallopeptidase [Clostridia bacterium]
KTEQQRIMTMKAKLETDKLALDDSKSSLLASKAVLDSKMAERDAMIQKIEDSQSALEAQLKEIEAEEAAVRAQIARLANGGTTYTGGAMLWPTPSCKIITSKYGWRLHPVLGYEKLHTGVDIGAGYNANIIAASSGKVITATYNSAYGNYVVIDHGGGVCTLYAHQSSIAVSVGQTVSAGQVIGYVGSTGYSTGPHLHFEVIINGSTVDPLGYIS